MPQVAKSAQGTAWKRERLLHFNTASSPLYWLLLLGVPALCVLWVLFTTPLSQPMSNYWTDASTVAHTGWLQQHFTPSGYPLTMALSLVLMPRHPQFGFALEQGVFHLLLVLLLWLVLRRLHATPAAALWATLLLQADPELLLSVEKVWDVAFSTWLLLLIVWLALRVLQEGAILGDCTWMAAALAFGSFDRPNYIFLAPALAGAIWFSPAKRGKENSAGQRLPCLLMAGVVVCGLYAGLSLLTYREVRTPENGAYNLFAGNNQFSQAALLTHLNAEPSIAPALAADGVAVGNHNLAEGAFIPIYRRASRQFARQHPLGELSLVGVKLWTMLRPDTKVHPLVSVAGVGKLFLAFFMPAWLVAIGTARRRGLRLQASDWLVVAVTALYFVPFLLTNADPRFRTPLDILLAAHTVALLWRGRAWTGTEQDAAGAGRTMKLTSFSG